MIPPAVEWLLAALAWIALACAAALTAGPVLAPEYFEPGLDTTAIIMGMIVAFRLVPTFD